MRFDLRQGRSWQRGWLLRRYKRFLADVRLADGRLLTVHCNNPGTMRSCCRSGAEVYISDSGNPRRKLRHTLEMIRMGRSWVGLDTLLPNRLLPRCLEAGLIPELAGYDQLSREVAFGPHGTSRVDLWLRASRGGPAEACVEIKNTTMRVGRAAAFPDAVSERGRRHLEDLIWEADQGRRAVMLFFVGRGDCQRFRPADEIDPAWAQTLRRAAARGVELLALGFRFAPGLAVLRGRLPIELGVR